LFTHTYTRTPTSRLQPRQSRARRRRSRQHVERGVENGRDVDVGVDAPAMSIRR
jgi:hypothetical protein